MRYPKILLSKKMLDILNQKEFPHPISPILPSRPIENNNFIVKFIFLALSIGIILINSTVGLILMTISLIWLISNPEGKEFNEKTKSYFKDFNTYQINKKEFELFSKITLKGYYELKRKIAIKNELRKSKSAIVEIDYKKGYTHEFFKKYLLEYFDNKIIENAALKIKNFNYNMIDDYKPYVTDFAYIDILHHLKIAIEIDEPYVLKSKKAIHFNDQERDNFFLENNWIVLRFAEIQIVNYPNLCCELLEHLIYILTHEYSDLNKLNSIVPKTASWTYEDSLKLIEMNYRESYLKNILKPNSYERQLEIRKTLNDMLNGPEPPQPV